jgi:pilus assembly protein Flp/PilA
MQMPLRFLKNESAATGIEYALVTSVISIVSIAAMSTLGTALLGFYTAITTALAAAF